MDTNRPLQFQKRSQLFIRTHNETLSIVAMRVCNPDRSPVGINRLDTTPTPAGFAEIVSDDFPLLPTDRDHRVCIRDDRGISGRRATVLDGTVGDRSCVGCVTPLAAVQLAGRRRLQ